LLNYLKFYEDRGLFIARAEGQYVWDVEGNKYLDFHTGHGVAFLGHRNPRVVDALKRQLDEVMVATPSFKVRVRDEMLSALEKVIPGDLGYVALLNSGSEAVELALKIARKATGRRKLVSFTNSFHGRTMGALSVTGSQKYKRGFEPLVPEVEILQFNDVESAGRVDESTAAVIVELVQGEGGVIPANQEFIGALKERVEEVGALLIVDEVQTGFGRTGRVWAFQHYNVKPDILVAGKAVGGGFPVSLVAVSEALASKLEVGDHGSTYGGNPLACAAVKASVEVLLEDNVAGKAESSGKILWDKLSSRLGGSRIVRSVRGLGLMLGVDLRVLPTGVIKCSQAKRLIVLKAGGTVVRLLPPYMITVYDIDWGVEVLARCVDEEASGRAPSKAS
jgi:acetylornithine aminotransferase apoenzyme (EC 2.6.1.11)/N2-acetyl-L-lysine aminotransferase apoenzyme (EC 2.6.1.-)